MVVGVIALYANYPTPAARTNSALVTFYRCMQYITSVYSRNQRRVGLVRGGVRVEAGWLEAVLHHLGTGKC